MNTRSRHKRKFDAAPQGVDPVSAHPNALAQLPDARAVPAARSGSITMARSGRMVASSSLGSDNAGPPVGCCGIDMPVIGAGNKLTVRAARRDA